MSFSSELQTADNSEQSAKRSETEEECAEGESPNENRLSVVPPMAIPSSGSAGSNTSSGSSESQSCAAHCCSPRRDADDNPRPLITICTAQHRMHVSCAKAWMSSAGSNNVSCPLCRDNAVFATLVAMREPEAPRREQPESCFRGMIRRISLFWCLFAVCYMIGIGLLVGGIYLIVAAKPTDVYCYFDGVTNCPLANTTTCNGGGCEYEQAKLQFLYRLDDGTSVRGSMQYRLDTCPDRCCSESIAHNEKLVCLIDAYNKTIVREFYRLATSPNYIVGAVCIVLGVLSLVFPVVYFYATEDRQRRG